MSSRPGVVRFHRAYTAAHMRLDRESRKRYRRLERRMGRGGRARRFVFHGRRRGWTWGALLMVEETVQQYGEAAA